MGKQPALFLSLCVAQETEEERSTEVRTNAIQSTYTRTPVGLWHLLTLHLLYTRQLDRAKA